MKSTILILALLPVMAQAQLAIRNDFEVSFVFPSALDSGAVRTRVGDDTTRQFQPYSAMVVFTLLQTWDAYLAWCADTVQKRGWDSWETDTTEYTVADDGTKLYFLNKRIPTYYRAPREEYPTIYGYIEWLRERARGKP